MGVYVLSDATRMVKEFKPSLLITDGIGIVDRDQKTQERWHSCPQILEKHRKYVELVLSKEHSQGFLSL